MSAPHCGKVHTFGTGELTGAVANGLPIHFEHGNEPEGYSVNTYNFSTCRLASGSLGKFLVRSNPGVGAACAQKENTDGEHSSA